MLWHCPELDLFESASERKKALRYAHKGIFYNGYLLAFFTALMVALVWLRPAVREYLAMPDSRFFGDAEVFVSSAVAGLCATYGAFLFSRRKIRTRLRERLNELGIQVCMSCGYRLRGLSENRCPECGTPF